VLAGRLSAKILAARQEPATGTQRARGTRKARKTLRAQYRKPGSDLGSS
jgi:hypothetical protein